MNVTTMLMLILMLKLIMPMLMLYRSLGDNRVVGGRRGEARAADSDALSRLPHSSHFSCQIIRRNPKNTLVTDQQQKSLLKLSQHHLTAKI